MYNYNKITSLVKTGFDNLSNKKKIKIGYGLLVASLLLFGSALGSSFGFSDSFNVSLADNFVASKGDTQDCHLHGTASTSYYGEVFSGIEYDKRLLKGETGKDWAKTVDSSYFALNNSNNRIIAQRRNGKATEVAVAPGMQVELNTHFLNHTSSAVAIDQVDFVVGDVAKLMQKGFNTHNIESKTNSLIFNGQTLRSTNNVMSQQTSIIFDKDGQSSQGPTFGFQAIQPVSMVGQREIKYETLNNKSVVKISNTLKNNMSEEINQLQIVTPITKDNIKTLDVVLAPLETKTFEQIIELDSILTTTFEMPEGVVKVNQSFSSILAKKSPYTDETGRITENDVKQTPLYFSRKNNDYKGTQWGNANQVNDLKVSIIPYMFKTKAVNITKPKDPIKDPVSPKDELKNDISLTKVIVDKKNEYKKDDQLTIVNTITNKGETMVNGFVFKDTISECFEIESIVPSFDSSLLILNSKVVDKNVVTYTFTVKNGFKPNDSFEIFKKYKIKDNCLCKDLANFGRVDLLDNKKEIDMENNKANVDFKTVCEEKPTPPVVPVIPTPPVTPPAPVKPVPPVPVIPTPTPIVPKLDLTLIKTIENKKSEYKIGDDIKITNTVKNIAEGETSGFSIIDNLKDCIDTTLITSSNLEYDKTKLTLTEFVIDGFKLSLKFNTKDKFKLNESYEISYKSKISKDCKCAEIEAPARVSAQGYSTLTEVNQLAYDITKELCKTNDNNCSTVKYNFPCIKNTLDYSITKTLSEGKSMYMENEVVKINLNIQKNGDLESNQFRITEILPKEIDCESYMVMPAKGLSVALTVTNLIKNKNIDDSCNITYVVTSDKNIPNGMAMVLETTQKIKVGAKCTNPVSPVRVDTTNNQIETPITNPTNGTCKIENTNKPNNCQPCSLLNNTSKDCKIVSCLKDDNNCSSVAINLECKEQGLTPNTPIVMEPKPTTPRTGGLELTLTLSGIMTTLLGQFLIVSTKRTKFSIDL